MPFGRNAGPNNQRLVNKIFNKKIGKNMEVYVNDLLVKSREPEQNVDDLREAFSML